jgi:hypothetical protein
LEPSLDDLKYSAHPPCRAGRRHVSDDADVRG